MVGIRFSVKEGNPARRRIPCRVYRLRAIMIVGGRNFPTEGHTPKIHLAMNPHHDGLRTARASAPMASGEAHNDGSQTHRLRTLPIL